MKDRHQHESGVDRVADAIYFGLTSVADAIETLGKKPDSKPKVHFDVAFGLPKTKGKIVMAQEATITNEQQINATLKPRTDTGKPAKVDGPPVWSVVSGDSTVVPAADGLSADLVSSDTPGDTVYLVDADADLGSGVEDLQETITLHVSGANAKNLGIAFGTPTAKPTPPPAP